jgi:hypothetical protein
MDAIARLAPALADRYRIERELGAGGMATVYLGRRPRRRGKRREREEKGGCGKADHLDGWEAAITCLAERLFGEGSPEVEAHTPRCASPR